MGLLSGALARIQRGNRARRRERLARELSWWENEGDRYCEQRAQRLWSRFLERTRHHSDPGGAFGTYWKGGSGPEREIERRRVGALLEAKESRVRARIDAAMMQRPRELARARAELQALTGSRA